MEQTNVKCNLMQNLHIMTQELAALCSVPAAAIPMPNPAPEALKLLPKMITTDDIEVFLITFKRATELEDCPLCD